MRNSISKIYDFEIRNAFEKINKTLNQEIDNNNNNFEINCCVLFLSEIALYL